MTTLLAAPPKPHPADPNRPWPGLPPYPGVWAMARPDDMPVPTSPGPPPPPTPKPGVLPYLASLAVVVAATPSFVLVPYLLDVRVMAALFFAAAVAAYPKSASPSAPRSRGAVLAVHAPLRQRAVRAGLPLLRPGRT